MKRKVWKKSLFNKKKIGNFLVIIGIVLIVFPLVGRIRHEAEKQKVIDDFKAEIQQQHDDLSKSLDWGTKEENMDIVISDAESVVTDVEVIKEELLFSEEITLGNQEMEMTNDLEEEQPIVEVVRPTTIALIEIPSINVVLPIAEGIDLFTLKYCVGYMPGSGEFGKVGNTVLAGHRGYTYGTYFNQLDEIEIGDVIKITTGDGSIYKYQVFDSFIVEPTDLSVLEQSENEKILTLITCHPKVFSTSRLIVQGVLFD